MQASGDVIIGDVKMVEVSEISKRRRESTSEGVRGEIKKFELIEKSKGGWNGSIKIIRVEIQAKKVGK